MCSRKVHLAENSVAVRGPTCVCLVRFFTTNRIKTPKKQRNPPQKTRWDIRLLKVSDENLTKRFVVHHLNNNLLGQIFVGGILTEVKIGVYHIIFFTLVSPTGNESCILPRKMSEKRDKHEKNCTQD